MEIDSPEVDIWNIVGPATHSKKKKLIYILGLDSKKMIVKCEYFLIHQF